MHVSAVQLSSPAVPDLDLAVSGGGAVADDKVVSQTVGHSTHIAMVIIENPRVTLPSAAVMNDDVFPSVVSHPGVINRLADRWGEILPTDAATAGSGDQVFF